jgi:hypothetical protein
LSYPIGFARSVLSLALRKPLNSLDAKGIKKANTLRREDILNRVRESYT